MIIPPSESFDGSDGGAKQLKAETIGTFAKYLDSLGWGPGQRDQSAWTAFLRAGSLGVNPDMAVEMVTKRIKAEGGTFEPSKIRSQIRRAYTYVGSPEAAIGAVSKAPRTEFSADKLKAMAAKVPKIDSQWLMARSPIATATISSAEFLEHLYQPGEKIVVFTHYESQGQFLCEVGVTVAAALPKGGTSGVWFLVNPVDGQSHPNPRQEGKLSRRSEESVTSWRYLVLESDVA